jgi:hydrogenase maturation protease
MNIACELQDLLRRSTCVVGVGNPLRRDDGAGVYLVRRLNRCAPAAGLLFLNAEDVIENHVVQMAEMPVQNILLVDAVATGSPPGSVVFSRLPGPLSLPDSLSTHRLSFSLTAEFLAHYGKQTFLLGIEAADTDYGHGLSDAVRQTADRLCGLLQAAIRGSRDLYPASDRGHVCAQ